MVGVFIFKLANTNIDKEPVIAETKAPIKIARVIAPKEESIEIREPETRGLAKKHVSKREVEIREYVRKFNIPKEAAKELFQAVRDGKEEITADNKLLTSEEFEELDMTLSEMEESPLTEDMENLISGYSVETQVFDDMVLACLPESAYEDPDSAVLKAQALADIGFSALAKQKYEDAENAFTRLIMNYPDEEATQISRLEYSNLLLEQGRINEAIRVVDEAAALNSDDNEYIVIAGYLKEKIEKYD